MRIAILIDGVYFRDQAKHTTNWKLGKETADGLQNYINNNYLNNNDELVTLFYYDIYPLRHQVYFPNEGRIHNLAKRPTSTALENYLNAIRDIKDSVVRQVNVSRLEYSGYNLTLESLRKLIDGEKKVEDLKSYDYNFFIDKTEIDYLISADIARLVYKHLVDKIILITGTDQFFPMAELARNEGVKFLFDSLSTSLNNQSKERINNILDYTNNKWPFNNPATFKKKDK